jgi:N-acetylglutamate synthase-like GNAT family acetyltransferase
LAFVGGEPAGLINGFIGFSTFAAKPLVNIHDCAVSPKFRRRGVCGKLLAAVESLARDRGCCKVRLSQQQTRYKQKHTFAQPLLTRVLFTDSPFDPYWNNCSR